MSHVTPHTSHVTRHTSHVTQLSLLHCTSLRRIDLSENPLESPPLDCVVKGGGWSYVKIFLQKIQEGREEPNERGGGGKLLLDAMHFTLLPSMVDPLNYNCFEVFSSQSFAGSVLPRLQLPVAAL